MVWLIVAGLLGNAQKAGLFATLGLVLFFTSGRLPQFVDSCLSHLSWYWVYTQFKTPPRFVFVTAFAVFVAAGLFLTSKLKHTGSWTKVLNLFALVLVMFPITEIARTKRPIMSTEQETGRRVDSCTKRI